jgi:hypothetical protein
VNNLFFTCPIARVVWGVLGNLFGTNTCPNSLWQAIFWFYAFLPGGSEMYMVGIAVVCWAIWTIRKKVTFDGYTLKSPIEVVFTMCSCLLYWAGLQANDDKEKVVARTRKLMKLAADVARRTKVDDVQDPAMIGD